MRINLRHLILMTVCAVALSAIADDGVKTTAYNFLSVPSSSHVYGLGGHNLTIIDDDINLVEQNPARWGSTTCATLVRPISLGCAMVRV